MTNKHGGRGRGGGPKTKESKGLKKYKPLSISLSPDLWTAVEANRKPGEKTSHLIARLLRKSMAETENKAQWVDSLELGRKSNLNTKDFEVILNYIDSKGAHLGSVTKIVGKEISYQTAQPIRITGVFAGTIEEAKKIVEKIVS